LDADWMPKSGRKSGPPSTQEIGGIPSAKNAGLSAHTKKKPDGGGAHCKKCGRVKQLAKRRGARPTSKEG